MIYLDNASTTKIDDRVLKAMMPYLTNSYGNAGTLYSLGREAAKAIGVARRSVGNLIGASPEQIIFTSGGSEANNMAILGLENYLKSIGKKRIVMSAIEHDSVLHAGKRLIKRGFDVTYITPSETGEIRAEEVKDVLERFDDVGLVSVMHTNNETGISNDVIDIGVVCKRYNVLFHTDCVQAAGSAELDVDDLNCDFLSISSHKIHGPKGVGALYARDKSILSSLIAGGNTQEFGLRGGTENVSGIVGFGKACEILNVELYEDINKMSDLLTSFMQELNKCLSKEGVLGILHVNGSCGGRTKTINIRFDDVDGETLLLLLDASGVYVSAGSACRSHESEPSHVLTALGLSASQARNSIRISVSKDTSFDDVSNAAKIIANCVMLLAKEA